MIKGEAVKNFTIMYLQDVNIWEKTPLDYEKYLSHDLPQQIEGRSSEGFVLPYGDSPLGSWSRSGRWSIFGHSKYKLKKICPYHDSISDPGLMRRSMCPALCFAKNGEVDVKEASCRIFPDKKYAFLLAHTYLSGTDGCRSADLPVPARYLYMQRYLPVINERPGGQYNLISESLYHPF